MSKHSYIIHPTISMQHQFFDIQYPSYDVLHLPHLSSSIQAPAATALEAVTQMLEEKKLSKKINYDALHAGLDEVPLAIMPAPVADDAVMVETIPKVPGAGAPEEEDDDLLVCMHAILITIEASSGGHSYDCVVCSPAV